MCFLQIMSDELILIIMYINLILIIQIYIKIHNVLDKKGL